MGYLQPADRAAEIMPDTRSWHGPGGGSIMFGSGVGVAVGVAVAVGVLVGDAVGVGVDVGVFVEVGVAVGDAVGVTIGVGVGVFVAMLAGLFGMRTHSDQSELPAEFTARTDR